MNVFTSDTDPEREEIRRVAWLTKPLTLFAILFTVYLGNGGFLPGDDVTGSLFLPVQILTKGKVTYSPTDHPFMFVWQQSGEMSEETLMTEGWKLGGRDWPQSSGYSMENLNLVDSRYYLSPSQKPREYVNTFGIGAGLYALPFFLVSSIFVDLETIGVHSLFYIGKVASAVAVAFSAVILFSIARRFLSPAKSLVVFLIYGLGTCVWSVASQTLWQHAPNLLFVSLTWYFFLKEKPVWRDYFWCGLCSGLATLCRPTSLILVMCLLGYVVWKKRRYFLAVISGAVFPGILMAVYNTVYLGAPWASAQIERSKELAQIKTGVSEVWNWGSIEGILGLLISPSRGLLIYSPILFLSIAGVMVYYRQRERFQWLGVPILVLGLQYLVASSWYDWWGGWAYGYRPLIDCLPMLCLAIVPVMEEDLLLCRSRPILIILAIYSVIIQGLGAFSYHLGPGSWNAGMGKNIDLPQFRHRLWEFGNNQIFHYLLNFPEAVREKSWNMDSR
jgi:hypothetical protein